MLAAQLTLTIWEDQPRENQRGCLMTIQTKAGANIEFQLKKEMLKEIWNGKD